MPVPISTKAPAMNMATLPSFSPEPPSPYPPPSTELIDRYIDITGFNAKCAEGKVVHGRRADKNVETIHVATVMSRLHHPFIKTTAQDFTFTCEHLNHQ